MSDFNPNWVVRPGETLQEEMEERGVSVRMVASICGVEPSAIQAVLDGGPIDMQMAESLSRLGISAQFWLNLEAQYRKGLAAGKKEL